MSKKTSVVGKNWLVSVNARDDDGNLIYDSPGNLQNVRIPMSDGEFNGQHRETRVGNMMSKEYIMQKITRTHVIRIVHFKN
jgi:hypothetical protein